VKFKHVVAVTQIGYHQFFQHGKISAITLSLVKRRLHSLFFQSLALEDGERHECLLYLLLYAVK